MARGAVLNEYDETQRIGRKKIRRTVRYASGIISVSDDQARIARSLVNDESKVHVVANGANPSDFPTNYRQEIRTELGISPETRVVLFCGGFIPRKGIPDLIELLPELNFDEDVHFVFIGHNGELRWELLEALKNSQISRYTVLWKVPPLALRRWFTAADILLLPSYAEGRPNVVYEAMASETAVLSTDIGGISEQVVDGETGILFEPVNLDELQTYLYKMVRQPELTERMGQKGHKRLHDMGWTWDNHAREINRIHQDIVDNY